MIGRCIHYLSKSHVEYVEMEQPNRIFPRTNSNANKM